MTLAHWKAGDLAAALGTGGEALNLFRDLGHRPTEGTVAYRLAAIARGLGRSRAARRYALMAMKAGEQSSTRTTIALAHVNLARLDIDARNWSAAADHLARCLELIDPEADRWVLVEALEALARLVVAVGRPGAGALLDFSSSGPSSHPPTGGADRAGRPRRHPGTRRHGRPRPGRSAPKPACSSKTRSVPVPRDCRPTPAAEREAAHGRVIISQPGPRRTGLSAKRARTRQCKRPVLSWLVQPPCQAPPWQASSKASQPHCCCRC